MIIEYYYVRNSELDGTVSAEYATVHKGKVIFKTEAEMRDGFPVHYPGCTIYSWDEVEETNDNN